jgi:hypothetical protein
LNGLPGSTRRSSYDWRINERVGFRTTFRTVTTTGDSEEEDGDGINYIREERDTPKRRIQVLVEARVISDIKTSRGKILPFIKKGINIEEDSFTSKNSLKRSSTKGNKISEYSEAEEETQEEYSNYSNHNTPIVEKK